MQLDRIPPALYVHLVRRVIEPLNGLVEWDRYAVRDDNTGFIFGWIKRDEGKNYDFVCVNFQLTENNGFLVGFNTSSAKYSKKIAEILTKSEEYLECKSVCDIPEANPVPWQKANLSVLAFMAIIIVLTRVYGGAIISGLAMSQDSQNQAGFSSVLTVKPITHSRNIAEVYVESMHSSTLQASSHDGVDAQLISEQAQEQSGNQGAETAQLVMTVRA